MNKKKIKKALREVARKHGVSVAEVRREIELATKMAQTNPDPQSQAIWDSIPRKGDRHTPEEVIAHISKVVDEKTK